jgi:hypothetical protein
MNEPFKSLIDDLRQELQQYGEMLARLDQQQESIMRRAADEVLASANSIQEQGAAILKARSAREETQQEVARHLRQSEGSTLAQLTLNMPPDYRPLMRALVEENKALLVRVQKRARQNHLLLSRSLTLMQELLHTVFPAGQRTVYDGQGNSFTRNPVACALYDAAG